MPWQFLALQTAKMARVVTSTDLTVQYHENRATVITDQITIQSEYDGRRPIKSVAGAAETNTGIYHRLLTNNASQCNEHTRNKPSTGTV